MLMEERRGAAILWCVQGDAAAGVEAEAKVDGGGGARGAEATRDRRETKRRREERKGTLSPIYKTKR